MRIILTIAFLIVVINLNYSQDFLRFFDSYNQNYNYNWRGIDNKQTLDFKDKFVDYARRNDLLKNEFIYYDANPRQGSVRNNLHVVDINGDNQEDVIYSGSSGGEPNVVKFFIQSDSDFKLVFSVYQGIVKVFWEKERIKEILTHDWGCCAEYRLINTSYNVSYVDDNPKFEKNYQSIEYQYMEKPLEFFEKPIKFIVDNEKYKLRAYPIIDDTSMINSDFNENRMGNTIGVLTRGTKGKAYGKRIDETGRVWWYVEVDNEFEVQENVLYMSDLKFPTHVIGWISSRYVTQIE